MKRPTRPSRPPFFAILAAGALVWLLPRWMDLRADQGVADPDPARFAEAMKAFERADRAEMPAPGGILFVGSSSIGRWDLERSFPGLGALNRGFGGSHLSDVVAHSERVIAPYKPRVIVLYAGDNDIAGGKTAERVRDDFLRVARLVREQAPGATLLFLSIKPSPSRFDRWPEMERANDLIRLECEEDERLVFVDVATPMLGPDGEPNPDLFARDRLHLNDVGYDLWAEVLLPHLGPPGPGDDS